MLLHSKCASIPHRFGRPIVQHAWKKRRRETRGRVVVLLRQGWMWRATSGTRGRAKHIGESAGRDAGRNSQRWVVGAGISASWWRSSKQTSSQQKWE